ncbi:cyclic nucleotide-binding domain-containing protein [Sphaerisporangium rubeum]|uniref:cyclic nucleotide-binding domain-containing protein n=1 Tax=Sphaerisporangium rubeum TaxID=321317 RepID=UPI00161668F5
MYQPHRALLGESLWAELRKLAREQRRPARSVLLRQGDPGTHVMALHTGSVMITVKSGQGKQTLISVRAAGELLGDLAVLDGQPRTATVIAAEACRVHAVPAPEFLQFVDKHALHGTLLRQSIGRLRAAERINIELAMAPVAIRLACTLVRLAAISAIRSCSTPHIILTQEELAQLIGASRNAVGSALKAWRDRGWVRTAPGGGLYLENVEALRAQAHVLSSP